MTDNPNKKSLWDKIHLDPTMLLILLALLTYSALVIWSASGQDVGMMERKIGQIAMGLVIMIVMAQIPPRVYEGWAPYLYIFCIILLVAVDAFGAISKGARAGWEGMRRNDAIVIPGVVPRAAALGGRLFPLAITTRIARRALGAIDSSGRARKRGGSRD